LTNGIVSYYKASAQQKKKLPKSRDNLQSERKTFVICSLDKGLIFRICKEFQKLNIKRISNSINKWANELNRKFSKEDVQIGNKYMKKYST
jgi:sugar diacid utilization regulator